MDIYYLLERIFYKIYQLSIVKAGILCSICSMEVCSQKKWRNRWDLIAHTHIIPELSAAEAGRSPMQAHPREFRDLVTSCVKAQKRKFKKGWDIAQRLGPGFSSQSHKNKRKNCGLPIFLNNFSCFCNLSFSIQIISIVIVVLL